MNRQAAVAVALAAGLAGCFGTAGSEQIDITKPISGEAATNAEKAYRRAESERKSSNFIEATRFYEWVKNNFPYSQYSALSELALADMLFDRDDFDGAAKGYEEFVKSHPSHPRADFAAYRVGLARYNDKASDSFILPPSYEREQTPVKHALDAFNRFLAAYPGSQYVNDAKVRVADCRRRLSLHERYVAEFYWKREAWRGSAQRWLGIGQTYGDLQDGKLRGEAFWRASEAFRKANAPKDEALALSKLIALAPQDEHRAAAEKRLQEMKDKQVPPAALGVTPNAGEVTPKEAPVTPKAPAATPGEGALTPKEGAASPPAPPPPENTPAPTGPPQPATADRPDTTPDKK